MKAIAKLDVALELLDELDETPLGQINSKLDRITDAVAAAKRELTGIGARNDNISNEQCGATLDALREIMERPCG